jgi:hypothetical protein
MTLRIAGDIEMRNEEVSNVMAIRSASKLEVLKG